MPECKEPSYVACFDLDDTLIETRYKYNLAMHRCAVCLIDAVGNYAPYGDELVHRFLELDDDFISVLQYDTRRFPLAWVAFYREICAQHGLSVDKDTVRALVEIAEGFRAEPFRLVPGAKELLYEMRRAGMEAGAERHFYLLTIGDAELQQRKLKTTGLWEFFGNGETVHIVPKDKVQVLNQIRMAHHKLPVFMIGDSPKNDVEAAYLAGVPSIRIPTPGHWHHDDAEYEADVTISRLAELPHTLRNFTLRGIA